MYNKQTILTVAFCVFALAVVVESTPATPVAARKVPSAKISDASKPIVLATDGANPTVALDVSTGIRYVAWIRQGKNSPEVVVVRSNGERGYADPVVASLDDTDIVSATVNPAQVSVGPKGEVYVLYGRRVPSQYDERGRTIPRLVRSTDGGRSFSAPVDVAAADGVETSAEATHLVITPDGTVIVAWLDYRDAFARAKLPEDQRPEDKRYLNSDDPKVQLRLARSTDGGLSFGPSIMIAASASERSRVALAVGPDGVLYSAWRAKLDQFKGSYDAVRDVLVSASSDGGATWSSPVKVHDDRFKAGDCPEITLGIGVDSKGRLHVAWYTGTSVRPGVYYAVSADQGRHFSKPLALLTAAWVPYADVKLAVDGSDAAWIAFEDHRNEHGERVVMVRIDVQGLLSQPRSWLGHSPDIAAREGAATLVWAGPKGAIQALQADAM
ncbi:hypothetical protein AU255_00635 [Methyloprofundus sedimenti]|uniref:Sialidase domain-containing protein n=1 Tax=Methyloprofundus sedimenti TaxID=1420851 RepID=A0A1V8M4G6_9GAMM|nr:sialidase family protein [Methyloprofundus sedimenti]OQK16449.1 hypothetical protein AU255_00635 [Methyloprofundus sedimenti]